MRSFTWPRLAVTVIAAASTYYLRTALTPVGLRALTFLLPVLFAAYLFGSVLASVAFGLTLLVIHAIVWMENPDLLFTQQYMVGILNYALFSALIILYAHRHEKVLWRLDESLAREKEARKEAEEANRLKDQFLATLSHELRTPINVILGYLEILLAERTRNPRRALEIVHRNAQQQARLIEDVLDVSRITTGTVQLLPGEVRPGAVLRDALESLQPAIASKGLRLDLGPMDEDVIIHADPDRLRQVFWNLLSNSIKFTQQGGTVSVRATTADGARRDRHPGFRPGDPQGVHAARVRHVPPGRSVADARCLRDGARPEPRQAVRRAAGRNGDRAQRRRRRRRDVYLPLPDLFPDGGRSSRGVKSEV